MILQLLKDLIDGFLLFSSMYVGSKCWNYLIKSGDSFKSGLKCLGWCLIYFTLLTMLNNF